MIPLPDGRLRKIDHRTVAGVEESALEIPLMVYLNNSFQTANEFRPLCVYEYQTKAGCIIGILLDETLIAYQDSIARYGDTT